MYQAKRMVFLMIVALLLTACSQAPTRSEVRKNLIEAYLVNRASGASDVEEPNIYGLDEPAKQTIVNQLSFDIVDGRELELIDYLDRQWPSWRSSEGFIVEYLVNDQLQREKSTADLPDSSGD